MISEDGRIDLCGIDSDADDIGIRPAMWINVPDQGAEGGIDG